MEGKVIALPCKNELDEYNGLILIKEAENFIFHPCRARALSEELRGKHISLQAQSPSTVSLKQKLFPRQTNAMIETGPSLWSPILLTSFLAFQQFRNSLKLGILETCACWLAWHRQARKDAT